MGRNPKPVDPHAPSAIFAGGLRALIATTTKSRTQIATETHYVDSVISDACAGWKLPTWDVTCAIVRVCGGDESEWAALWDAEHLRRSRGSRRR